MIIKACANGHKDVVELLMVKKANVNLVSIHGRTALHYGDYKSILKIMKIRYIFSINLNDHQKI